MSAIRLTALRATRNGQLRLALLSLTSITLPSIAHAQQTESLLIQPALPEDFDRGRNVSVLQRARPDYDPLGVPVGSLNVFPRLTVGTGYSNNLFYSKTNQREDGYLLIAPGMDIQSDWSRHEFDMHFDAQHQRFFNNSIRDQTPWNLQARGILEIGSNLRVVPEAQIARQYETPFTGEASSQTAVLSNYIRKYAGLRGEYAAGQSKLTLAVDDTNYQFSNIVTEGRGLISQRDRDRNILRATAQGQYAFTPSMAAYVQLSYANTVYDDALLLSGLPNRDSDGYRAIGGFNFDLAGLLRGTIGAGYAQRDYKSPVYPKVSGFSAEAKIEYFPTELTTLTLTARRVIEDSTFSSTNSFFDNRVSLRADHELRRNALIYLQGEYARQDYIGTSLNSDVYRITGGGRYLGTNWWHIDLDLGYTGRSRNNSELGQEFNEFRGQVAFTVKG